MSKKDKINFDTDFLDQIAKEKPKENQKSCGGKETIWVFHNGNEGSSPTSDTSGMSDSVKKWALGIVIVMLIIIFGSNSDDGSSTSTTSNSAYQSSNSALDGSVRVGQYWCSSYAASHADSILPSKSEETSLSIQLTRVENAGKALNVQREALENEYVDETSQYAIDAHNERVDSYNRKYKLYSDDYDDYERKLPIYNQKVQTYNNYLASNCRAN